MACRRCSHYAKGSTLCLRRVGQSDDFLRSLARKGRLHSIRASLVRHALGKGTNVLLLEPGRNVSRVNLSLMGSFI